MMPFIYVLIAQGHAAFDVLEGDEKFSADARRLYARARRFFGIRSADDWLTTKRVARMFKVTDRVVREKWGTQGLKIHGPRGARVIRRADLDEWLLSRGAPKKTANAATTETDADVFARAAARIARSA